MSNGKNKKSKYITADVPHVDPNTVRPNEAGGVGSVRGRVVNSSQRINYAYPDPAKSAAAMVANWGTKEVADNTEWLYNAGYFTRNEMKWNPVVIDEYGNTRFTGQLNKTIISALTRAMEDANYTGTQEWTNISRTRQNEITAGIRGSFYGETAADSAAKDSPKNTRPQTTLTQVLTSRSKSDAQLDNWFKQNLGRVATKREKDSFYKILNKKQLDPKYAQSYTTKKVGNKTVVIQGDSGVSVEDEVQAFGIAHINFADTKALGTAVVKDTVQTVKNAASSYGLNLSQKDITRYATGILNGTMQPDSIKGDFADRAKNYYKAYADKISDQVSVKDIASDYINRKAQILEISPDSLSIKDVDEALTGDTPMSFTNFDTLVKNDPRYQNTNAAKSRATALATGILRSFGYGGNG